MVQGRLSASFCFHISTGPSSQHQVDLGPSQAASSLWKKGASSPIPTLLQSPQADHCQIQDPAELPGWSRQAQQCRSVVIPAHLVKWILAAGKTRLISRYLCVGVLPQRGALAHEPPVPAPREGQSQVPSHATRKKLLGLGDSSHYPACVVLEV